MSTVRRAAGPAVPSSERGQVHDVHGRAEVPRQAPAASAGWAGPVSAYLIHWTSTRAQDCAPRGEGVSAVMTTQRVESDAELIGFLLNLPGDGSFVVRAVSEVPQ